MKKAGGAKPGEGRELGVSSVLAAALWLRDDGAGWGQAGDDPSKIGPPPIQASRGRTVAEGPQGFCFLPSSLHGALLCTPGHLLLTPVPPLPSDHAAGDGQTLQHETECITFLKDFTYSKDDFHRAGTAKCRVGSGVPAGQETQGLTSLSELPSLHLPTRVRAEPTHLTVRAKSTVRLLSPDSAQGGHGAGCDRGVCAVI